MFCPECKAEYRPGFVRCSDCKVELVDHLPVDPSPIQCETSDSELVVVRRYLNEVDADLARMALESAGIESMIRLDGNDVSGEFLALIVSSADVGNTDKILSLEALQGGESS